MAMPFPSSERGNAGLSAYIQNNASSTYQNPLAPVRQASLDSLSTSIPEKDEEMGFSARITAFFGQKKVLKTIGLLPVFLLLGIFGFSWYGYNIAMIQLTRPGQMGSAEVFKMIGFHILFALTLLSLARAILTHPGTPEGNPNWVEEPPAAGEGIHDHVPTDSFPLPGHERQQSGSSGSMHSQIRPATIDPEAAPQQQQDSALYPLFKSDGPYTDTTYQPPSHWSQNRQSTAISQKTVTVKYDGRPRYCRKCRVTKPDRAHHCRLCQQCVLRMDHHCPWLNNCVGHHNYKFFILFLTWTSVFCAYIFATTAPAVIWALGHRRFPVMPLERNVERNIGVAYLLLASGMFGIFLTCFAIYHMHLVTKNTTNLESMDSSHLRTKFAPAAQTADGKAVNLFNLGAWKNWKQVFGEKWWLWFVPVHTTLGDGLTFPLNEKAYRAVPAVESI